MAACRETSSQAARRRAANTKSNVELLEDLKRQKIFELTEWRSRPDYSIDGQSVQGMAYEKSLLDEIKQLAEMIIDEGAADEGPFEFHSVGVT